MKTFLLLLFTFALSGRLTAQSGCSVPAPDNFFLAMSDANLKANWTASTSTSGYWLEITDITTMQPFFTTEYSGGTHSATISGADVTHQYVATLRGKCGNDCISNQGSTSSSGRIVVEDVVFFNAGCGSGCNPFPAPTLLAGDFVSWAVCNSDFQRSYFNLLANGGAGPAPIECRLKIARDCNNQKTVLINDCACPYTLAATNDTIYWGPENNLIATIYFSNPNKVNIFKNPGWTINYRKTSCSNQPPVLAGEPPVEVQLSIEETSAEPMLVCQPNPASGELRLSWSLPEASDISLRILNAAGSVMATPLSDHPAEAGEGFALWNAQGLSPGIYFVEMQTGGRVQCEKVVLQ